MAGVSQSSVSRTFSPGSAAVSPGTAERVRAAALRLGYRPNALARSLITGNSRIIGLVARHLENQLYPSVLELLCQELDRRGYHVLMFMPSEDETEAETIETVARLLDYQVEGLISAFVSPPASLVDRCRSEGIPMVLFNRHQGVDGPTSVASNNLDASRLVARFLLEGGHQRIAHISGSQTSSTGRERMQGFQQGLAEGGGRLFACLDGDYRRDRAAEACLEMFAADRKWPDAIFVGGDYMAVTVLDVLRFELGINVPDEVSLVGFDDVPLASWPSFNLTTMRQPLLRMVNAAIDKLLQTIEEDALPPEHLRFPCDFKIRGTARVPENWRAED